ncbi:hypothetical protein BO83DRAFT_361182 [Aspergillus eucalypticola CBS 122712]|uniref:GPI anchored protein n=1 Tax=Aspergillus eucalypticola (strain CBS 122712 / IBT 29274) TaxID=1448314 RepID=A0A317VI10_ASPEC|nr:uncharacterized protein BO83DRAFT_361182 [Aspergillus eucalypticola CBS 122712]PWY73545.1 hypothetical protein BO83DRAFT_361182 [Aspergillus eucalypticola CBS 122712]
MRIHSFALLAGATIAIATQTVSLFLIGFDEQQLEGKIIGTTGSMTEYLIKCAADVDSTECGLPPNGMTVAQGSSTVSLAYSTGRITIAENCNYDSISVTCAASLDEEGITTTFTSAVALTEIPGGGSLLPVTITGTATEKAAATTGASVSAFTAASTSGATLTTSASTTGGTSAGTSTSASSDSRSAAATSQTESGNAAMPMITGDARWAAAGGAAAVLALAVL